MFPNQPQPAHEHCPSCKLRKPEPEQPCPRCGWWERRDERQCLHCKGPINFDTGPGIDKALGVAGAGTGAVAFFFVGWLGGLALASLACAASSLYCALVTSYRCGMCDRPPAAHFLAPEERRRVRNQKVLMLGITVGLAALGLGLGALWLFLFRSR